MSPATLKPGYASRAVVYRKGTEVRVLFETAEGPVVAHAKAGKSVPWRRCVDRALANCDVKDMGPWSSYTGERVTEWPEDVA